MKPQFTAFFSSNTLYIGKALLNRAHGKTGNCKSDHGAHDFHSSQEFGNFSNDSGYPLASMPTMHNLFFFLWNEGGVTGSKASENRGNSHAQTSRPQTPSPVPAAFIPRFYGAPMIACGRFVWKPEKIKTTGNLCGPCRPSSKLTERKQQGIFCKKQESLVVLSVYAARKWRPPGAMGLSVWIAARLSAISSRCFHLNVQW